MVVCRFRPLNWREREKARYVPPHRISARSKFVFFSETVCVEFHPDKKSCTINYTQVWPHRSSSRLPQTAEGSTASNKFHFDRVFDTKAAQKEVYDVAAKPIIEGTNVVFCRLNSRSLTCRRS